MHERSSPLLNGGQLLSAISNAIVGIQRDSIGRGPTSARATMAEDLVTVLLRDTLTKAEVTLAANGESEFVLQMRHRFQEAMREDMVAAVEGLTGRTVVAFMSTNHIDPDMGCEIFVLAPVECSIRDEPIAV